MTTTTTAQDMVLRLQNISRTYGSATDKRNSSNTVTALGGVSLDCHRGTWTAVMGPSGSGKSTLLNCAAGLDRPDSGQIQLDGRDITGLSDDALTTMRRTDIGFIFQQFNLVAALTATENVTLPLRLAGVRDAENTAVDTLASLGLGDHLDHRPRELSGGQQQRVAIARALAIRPAVLFADEPTGALDSTSADVVLTLLRTLVARETQTVLMVTHDPRAAAAADRVVFLRDGRLVTSLDGADAATIAATLADLGSIR